METQSTPDANVFQQLATYPWESDEVFQSGLRAILGSDTGQERADYLTLQAQCFYYSRNNNVAIDFDAYQKWRAHHTQQPGGIASTPSNPEPLPIHTGDVATFPSTGGSYKPSATDKEGAPYPTSFSQIVDLITTGKPIPGVKDIPDTILSGQESKPVTTTRKKPWEITTEGSEGVTEGTKS